MSINKFAFTISSDIHTSYLFESIRSLIEVSKGMKNNIKVNIQTNKGLKLKRDMNGIFLHKQKEKIIANYTEISRM